MTLKRQALNDFTYFGTYEDAEKKCLDVLTVELKSSSKVERARSLQRNLIGKYLKTNLKDSALVAFYSKDNLDWRLSFVKMDYRLDERGVKVEIGTPPKRYSFLVGKTEPSHTAQKQLLPLLDDRKVPTLDEIEKSFSIEKVTKEFYTEIAKKFTELVGGERKIGSKKIVEAGQLKYPKPSDTLRKEFAVRLIGRLMFCWFLKKKKSEGDVPLIPNVILSSDAIIQYPDYYHSLLEPLFFQVLNTQVEKRNKSVRHSFWNNVPFLNGGLFEPHLYDYYEIYYESGLSKYINTLKVPDSWFLDLFKIFEVYNFTIDESTTIDVDISVDPEMLGRIFENLLAEINPETGETARKSTGSYYTPRPIVEYMVDESLKQYLLSQIPTLTKGGEGGFLEDENKLNKLLSYGDYEIDLTESEKDAIIDALDRVKIIDPACGSGAFPMGILHKMLLVLQKIDPESKKWLSRKLARIDNELLRKELEKKLKTENWDYVHKLGIIQNSIYGVDIQPIAVEISKLRFFLSLIVDEKIDDDKPNRGVVPLPNLEFKFVAANSLIGLPKAEDGLAESHKDIEKLKELRDTYFTSYGDEKRKIENEFKETQERMFNHALNWQATGSQTYKLSEWNPFEDTASSWFDPEWMFGVKDGFDVVIANPPWGAKLTNDEKLILKNKYPEIDSSTPNSFAYFIGVAKKVNKGIVSYVLPDSILIKDFAKTRKLLKPYLTILNWYQNIGLPEDFRPFVYVEHDVCNLFFNNIESDKLLCSKHIYDSKVKAIIPKIWFALKNRMIFEDFDSAYNLMLSEKDLAILNKLNKFKPINSYMQCHEGIHTGNARDILFKSKKENKWCKPLYYGAGTGGDEINNYVSKRKGWYVDYRKELIDKKKGYYASLRDERIFIHPKIYITRTGNPFKAFLDLDSYASNNFFSLQFKDYSHNDIDNQNINIY